MKTSTTTLGTLWSAVALCTVPCAASDLEGSWEQKSALLYKFSYSVGNLPDFDQVRAGLPNCGRNYCVPAATANVLAWISNHGFPTVGPGPNDWTQQSTHGLMTAHIASLGNAMGTDPSKGTKRDKWFLALAGGFGTPAILPPSAFTVTAMFLKNSYKPRMYVAAKSAILNDGLVALCHGWYKPFTCAGWQPVLRDGGHCLTLQAVSGYWVDGAPQYGADVDLHDPGSHEGFFASPPTCVNAVAPNSQSPFVAHRSDLSLEGLYAPLGCSLITTLDQLYASFDQPGVFRLVDAYLMVSLKKGYTFSGSTASFISGKGFEPSPGPPASTPIATLDASIHAAAVSPDLDAVVLVAGSALHLVDSLLRRAIPFPPGDYLVEDPVAATFGRNRALYVAHAWGISCIDLDGLYPLQTGFAWPPNPCDFVAYADTNDAVWALSRSGQAIYRYGAALEGEPETVILHGIDIGTATSMVADPLDDSLWIGLGTQVLLRVVVTNGEAEIQEWDLDGVATPIGGFDIDSGGHLIATVGGVLREFERSRRGTTWIPIPDAPFNGLPGGSGFIVTRSRTNFDPAVHDTPEWDDVFPEAPPAPITCLGDLDGTGFVDGGDLGLLLAAWGPAPPGAIGDLDGDGDAGGADLGLLLASWGPCPIPWPGPTTLLVDACQAATLVEEGSHDFSTLHAGTDGPTLPSSCNEGSGLAFGQDIWALYVPSRSGTVTVSTCGSADYDTRLAAYLGLCGSATLVACNDDTLGCGLTSSMSFPAAEGDLVLLRIGGFAAGAGTGNVTIAIDPTIVADQCDEALPVGEGTVPFSTLAASAGGPLLPPECEEGAGLSFGPDVWALYVPSANGRATISTCGTANFDTRLAAYRFDCQDPVLLACNDDSPQCPGLTSTITVPATAGVPIRVRLGGFGSAVGSGTVSISLQ